MHKYIRELQNWIYSMTATIIDNMIIWRNVRLVMDREVYSDQALLLQGHHRLV